ncbi:MAG: hypothetical protein EAZ14_10490 [Runella slithyformis]|nr:MAG: hypothetical protein EAZ14_10490 [Runella slithyformis]
MFHLAVQVLSKRLNGAGAKTAYLEAQKEADLLLTVLQTLCLSLVRGCLSEHPEQRGSKI